MILFTKKQNSTKRSYNLEPQVLRKELRGGQLDRKYLEIERFEN